MPDEMPPDWSPDVQGREFWLRMKTILAARWEAQPDETKARIRAADGAWTVAEPAGGGWSEYDLC